jgi:hypothetical protein
VTVALSLQVRDGDRIRVGQSVLVVVACEPTGCVRVSVDFAAPIDLSAYERVQVLPRVWVAVGTERRHAGSSRLAFEAARDIRIERMGPGVSRARA